MKNILIGVLVTFLLWGATNFDSQAFDYPTKPIELVVTYAPGGSTDTTARIVSALASDILKQPIVVINKTGAGGAIGLNFVVKAKPDGYTLIIAAPNMPIIRALNPQTGYHPINDFAPICNFITQANILVVPSSSKITSVAEYVEAAKKNPGTITISSAGVGGTPHLSGELFKRMANIDITHVPFKGSHPQVMSLLGGHTDSGFVNAPDCLEHIRAGKLRALAVTSSSRIPELPNISTIAEIGYPGYEVISWIGCAAPGGTSSNIVKKLADVFKQVMQDLGAINKMKSMGFTPAYMSPEKFGSWIKSEFDKYTVLAKEANIKLE